jgi:hypothetical protein
MTGLKIEVDYPWTDILASKGGAGSGNWGHTGRVGKRGGSGGGGGLGRIGGSKGMTHAERKTASKEHKTKRKTKLSILQNKHKSAVDMARMLNKRGQDTSELLKEIADTEGKIKDLGGKVKFHDDTPQQEDINSMSQSEVKTAFSLAKTRKDRVKYAEATLRKSQLADKTVAKKPKDIPTVDVDYQPSLSDFKTVRNGKMAISRDKGWNKPYEQSYNLTPVVRNKEGKYFSGAFGQVIEVIPEFD